MVNARLSKDLKLRNLFTLAFGSIIGVGWITVLGSWLTQAGALGTIIAFLFGGTVMLLIGLCYAEIGAMYPVSGGEVAYLYEMYGVEISFFGGWFLALNYIGLTAFEAISVGWVLSAIFPGIGGPVLYSILGVDVQLFDALIGLALMLAITFINYRGGKVAAGFQDVMTYILLAASVVFIAIGIGRGDAANLEPFFVRSEGLSGSVVPGILAVFATVPFWFSGFDTIPQAMGEKSKGAPLHLLPRVIVLAIVLSGVFYCLVVLASAMALPRGELLALELPVAGALEVAFDSPLLGKLVLLAGLCGLITSWNAFFFAGSRLIFALGNARMISGKYGEVHPQFGSPAKAILFVGFMGAVLSLLGKNAILPIINVGATSMSLVFLLVSAGLIRLRKTQPDMERPYTVPCGSLIPCLAVVMCLSMLGISLLEPYLSSERVVPVEWILLVSWLALGYFFWGYDRKARGTIDAERRREMILSSK